MARNARPESFYAVPQERRGITEASALWWVAARRRKSQACFGRAVAGLSAGDVFPISARRRRNIHQETSTVVAK